MLIAVWLQSSFKLNFKNQFLWCQENGVYSNVVIIQRHQRILTNEDAAFLIKCDEKNMHKAQIIVTETMMTMSKKNSEYSTTSFLILDKICKIFAKFFRGSEDYYKSQMKQSLYDKKAKTLFNDKETITYVGSAKNHSSNLIVAKQ